MEPNSSNLQKFVTFFEKYKNILYLLFILIILGQINMITTKYDLDLFVRLKNLLKTNIPVDKFLTFTTSGANIVLFVYLIYYFLRRDKKENFEYFNNLFDKNYLNNYIYGTPIKPTK
jgi:hypothetical protein